MRLWPTSRESSDIERNLQNANQACELHVSNAHIFAIHSSLLIISATGHAVKKPGCREGLLRFRHAFEMIDQGTRDYDAVGDRRDFTDMFRCGNAESNYEREISLLANARDVVGKVIR